MELRISVEAAGSGDVIDSEIRDLTVPDLTGQGLSTPRVYRARNALDFRAAASNGDAVPAATREFLRRDRLLIRFDVYGADAPAAALLNRAGTKMTDLPIAPAAAGGTHQIDFGLGAVAPGEYLVEISVGDVKELVPLKVGS
jgi:hypothetical protein